MKSFGRGRRKPALRKPGLPVQTYLWAYASSQNPDDFETHPAHPEVSQNNKPVPPKTEK